LKDEFVELLTLLELPEMLELSVNPASLPEPSADGGVELSVPLPLLEFSPPAGGGTGKSKSEQRGRLWFSELAPVWLEAFSPPVWLEALSPPVALDALSPPVVLDVLSEGSLRHLTEAFSL